jgi:hypothetical protein
MAKGSKDSNDGCATGVGGALFVIVVLIAMIPKPVWIGLGVIVAIAAVAWLFYWVTTAYETAKAAAAERARAEQAAKAAADKRQRDERARKAKQQRIEVLGAKNAALVESAAASVKQVVASEAARAGWLGDVDFTADIKGIAEFFRKAHALRKVADELSELDSPSSDDRRILGEAEATAAKLERAGVERVQLIGQCATEANLIDESLRNERKDARTAEQRAELHSKLSAMLYGIEATPEAMPADSAADAVMARVWAYREIKNQIQLARDGEFQ